MPSKRFREEFFRFVEETDGRRKVTCREEAIELAETAVQKHGLAETVSAHLAAAYGARSLAELSDSDLRRALRFVARLEEMAPQECRLPLRPGMVADGDWCLFRGTVRWSDAT